jgi:hypothetical protein
MAGESNQLIKQFPPSTGVLSSSEALNEPFPEH